MSTQEMECPVFTIIMIPSAIINQQSSIINP
jgi:hypothetical protein